MKMKLLVVLALLSIAFLFSNFKPATPSKQDDQPVKKNLAISVEVQKIIDNSCIGCHNAGSKNEKGKAKLTFESLDTLSVAKLVGKLGKISEEVSEGKMPPEKFLEFKPEAKLTPAQKDALIKWADLTANSFLEK